MSLLKYLPKTTLVGLTRIRLALLISFSLLMLWQLLVGFVSFDDYLIGFVYVLFLNDLYMKLKHPEILFNMDNDGTLKNRNKMSLIFLILFTLPFLLDVWNISDGVRMFLYKIGFILWGQVFLLDAYLNYKQTKSYQWLGITVTAVLIIIVGSIV